MASIKLICGDALTMLKTLPPNSVHCAVTSPPYYLLRDYGFPEQYGLEQSWQEHVAVMRAVFEEVRRVLHPSGSLWLNYGDTYCSGGGAQPQGLKPGDLMGIPWRVAFALQEAGWYLRSDSIWLKSNAMPSSADDRPSVNHEYMFLLTKSRDYYYDKDGTRVLTGNEATWEEYIAGSGMSFHDHSDDAKGGMGQKRRPGFKSLTHPLGRALRTVMNVPTEPQPPDPDNPEKHYAAFATKLIEPLIKASTSDKGCCPVCLEPWVREYEDLGYSDHGERHKRPNAPGAVLSQTSGLRTGKIKVRKPVGWKAGCRCIPCSEPQPCCVLDPFSGTGTTGLVAVRWNRDYIGIEGSLPQILQSKNRLEQQAPLLNRVEVIGG
jgi:DNA modification methylase